MAHELWCGSICAECLKPCALDRATNCALDCPDLYSDGTPCGKQCKKIKVVEVA
jgi:hypothetical protein